MRDAPIHDDSQREIEELREALRSRDALLSETSTALAEKDALIAEQQTQIARLERHVAIYEKLAFGKVAPSRPRPQVTDPRQGHLFAALLAEAEEVAKRERVEGTVELVEPGRAKKGKAKRRAEFPDHVPHFRSTYEIPESDQVCLCGAMLKKLGDDVTKELERLETTILHEIARAKYGCPRCGGAARTAPGPDRVIEKGLLGPGFLAHVMVERFLHHMPYHRQQKKYESEGLPISRAVLERSAARCAELLSPVVEQIKREILASPVIFTDDTPVTVARASNGSSGTGRIWDYCDLEGRILYDFTESRKRDGPLRMLLGYEGYVQADAYAGYDALYLPGGAREVACFAHVKRKIEEAQTQEPDLVQEGLTWIRALYRVETEARVRELTPEQRHDLRQEKSRPLLQAFRAWLDRVELEVLPKGLLAEAVRYVKNQWKALNTYLEDGRLEIDNNRAERGLRPLGVGRANWTFFLNPQGGKNAAILLTLVRTAKEIKIDPKAYLRDVLLRIAHEPDVSKLTPHGWKRHFADEVMRGLREAALSLKITPSPAPAAP